MPFLKKHKNHQNWTSRREVIKKMLEMRDSVRFCDGMNGMNGKKWETLGAVDAVETKKWETLGAVDAMETKKKWQKVFPRTPTGIYSSG